MLSKSVNHHRSRLFLLFALEALLCLAGLFAIPGEGGSGAVLGYSRSRWMLAVWLAGMGLASFLCAWLANRPDAGVLTAGKRLKALCWGLLFCSAVGVYFLFVCYGLTDAQIRGYFLRLVPLALWMTLVSLEGFLYLVWQFYGCWAEAVRRDWRKARAWTVRYTADLLGLAAVLVFATLLIYPLTTGVSRTDTSDYLPHVRTAARIEESGKNETPYFLYQLLIIAGHEIYPAQDILTIGIVIAVAFQVFTAAALYLFMRWSMRRAFRGRVGLRAALSAALALALLLVTPITLLTAGKQNLYYGYIGMQVYHNPTVILLKPLALLLFLGMLPLYGRQGEDDAHPSGGLLLLLGGVALLGILAKPNYIIAFLPAAGLIWLGFLLRRRKFNWLAILLGVFLPAAILLAWQYFGAYGSERVIPDEGGITFAPLAVYSRNSDHLPGKFLLSILFPLAVTLGYPSKAKRDFPLGFAWLVFAFGAFYTYFFAESGMRLQDANFAWCGQVTLFVLFVVAAGFFARRIIKEGWNGKAWICSAIFCLHLLSGLLWFCIHVLRPWDAWW